jgi:hypothetical protein
MGATTPVIVGPNLAGVHDLQYFWVTLAFTCLHLVLDATLPSIFTLLKIIVVIWHGVLRNDWYNFSTCFSQTLVIKDAMPVTVRPANHPPRAWTAEPPARSADQLLGVSCHNEHVKSKRVIQSSFTDLTNANICASSNGFVRAIEAAYSQHHHLSIRPEDVWVSILTQFSFYVNAHAEELRSFFVAHEGQKQLVVKEVGTLETVDVGLLAVRLTKEMENFLVDEGLRDWIMPTFTTTTTTDTITAAVIMMGTMQNYFSYKMCIMCGIPSVTLLGEKSDWIDIRRRVDKLARFGKEPEQFSRLLAPVLDYFIRTFENVDDPKVVDFWSKVTHRYNGGSGPTWLSGWITAFCFWDAEGKLMYREPQPDLDDSDPDEGGCNLDGTLYHRIDIEDIPNGYVSVPVLVDDNGKEFKTKMVAGSVGIAVSSSGEKLDTTGTHKRWVYNGSMKREFKDVTPEVSDATGLDSLQPVTGWWMYELAETGQST